MSSETIGWVWRYSPYRGATLLVHLAIADSVNDQHDYELWMLQSTVARKARVGRQAANEALKTLERDGFLQRVGGGKEKGEAVRYRFRFRRHLPAVYEARAHLRGTPEGVASDDTPLSPETTGVSPPTTPGVAPGDTEPKKNPRRTSTPDATCYPQAAEQMKQLRAELLAGRAERLAGRAERLTGNARAS